VRATATVVLTALLLGAPAWAAAVSQRDVEESLTCQCGCGLTVHSCNHLQCPSGEPMKAEIRRRIAAGETKDRILAAFVAKYGEKVLSAPTMRGFNWLAWITPFAVVLIAGTVLVGVVRRRVGQRTEEPPGPQSPAAGDPELRARLRRELEDIDREP
jgi:cytochrome c-type biogenesis protein CcmH/NrfF